MVGGSREFSQLVELFWQEHTHAHTSLAELIGRRVSADVGRIKKKTGSFLGNATWLFWSEYWPLEMLFRTPLEVKSHH